MMLVGTEDCAAVVSLPQPMIPIEGLLDRELPLSILVIVSDSKIWIFNW